MPQLGAALPRRVGRVAGVGVGVGVGVGMALLLGACSSLAPAPPAATVQPSRTADVPANWSAWSMANAAGGAATGADATSLATWWQRFNDPALTAWVQLALQHNTRIQGAQAALQQAQALRDGAAAGLLPSLGSSASAQRGTAGGHSTGKRFQLGLDGTWVPDIFGARRAAVDAGNATLAASAASLGDVQVQVAAEVALNAIALRSAQARLAWATSTLASQQETLQITQWREQAGLVTALETAQARAAVAQNQALLPAWQASIAQARHALAVLTGQPPEAGLDGVAPATSAVVVPQAQDALALAIPADTLRQRADVRAAEHQVAAALARVGQAQAQRWPSFAIGGSLGLSALSLGALTSGASVVSSLLASISLPVFDGGAARAQVRAEQAALAQAEQVYRAAVLGALQDVEDALALLQGDRLRLVSLRSAADAAGNAALLARQRYSSGLVDFQTVLQTQRTQFSTQDSVASALADLGTDQVRLFKALGGGWAPVGLPPTAATAPPEPRTLTP